jgi:5'-3' exonuclease
MGIPSYFSYVIKQYPNIIKKYNKHLFKIQNLYLDSNSIVYDVYNNLITDNQNQNQNQNLEQTIISLVIKKIEYYINTINPSETVIIAFDGVPPVSKLEQQRNRRYKSWYQSQIKKKIFNLEDNNLWSTSSITPGTNFMKLLDNTIYNYFNKEYATNKNIKQIITSGSNVCGEGEHKIFNYIRNNINKHLEQYTFIYGLDADLIMLCINHLNMCPNIYLYRETPQFIKSIDSSLEPNSDYYLDISELTNAILLYLNNDKNITIKNNKINDYIFLCFLLGNDFLPHFPALNIRTGGIDKLLNAYRETIKEDELLTDGKTVYWNSLHKFIDYLSKLEESYIINEYKLRDKRSNNFMTMETPEDKLRYFDSIPLFQRDIEKYINPSKSYWSDRYYISLFGLNNNDKTLEIKDICINYLQGLEWTIKYYSSDCPDWRWSYKHNYPPLLSDLIKYIPVFNTELVPYRTPNPVSEIVQLCYVLPNSSLSLLPIKLRGELIRYYSNWYKNDCDFIWAFCRYFWECHVELPEININTLETFINNNKFLLV